MTNTKLRLSSIAIIGGLLGLTKDEIVPITGLPLAAEKPVAGSAQCRCGRTISANKEFCKACAEDVVSDLKFASSRKRAVAAGLVLPEKPHLVIP